MANKCGATDIDRSANFISRFARFFAVGWETRVPLMLTYSPIMWGDCLDTKSSR